MKTAINFSGAAEALLLEGRIHPDRWKCAWEPEWMAWALRSGPFYIHFPFETSAVALGDTDWSVVQSLLAKWETPFVNLHLVAKPEQFPEESSPVDSFLRCVRELTEGPFSPSRVIVENVVARANGKLSRIEAVQPDVIAHVVRETGCGFLLDTAHLRITCLEHGWDVEQVLDALPLDHLKELHVTGVDLVHDVLFDSMPMQSEDWAVLDSVLERIRSGRASTPWIMALEYGGIGEIFEWRSDPAIIERDLDLLTQRVEGF